MVGLCRLPSRSVQAGWAWVKDMGSRKQFTKMKLDWEPLVVYICRSRFRSAGGFALERGASVHVQS